MMEPRLSDKPLPLDRHIAVGFGYAALERDGVPVWTENECDDEGSLITVAQAEAMAALDPEHDWRISFQGPLQGAVFQRQAPRQWFLVEENEGFA